MITIRPQNPHPEITLTESFNRHNLRKYVTLGLCDTEYQNRLSTYLAAADGNEIQIKYTDLGIGRLEAVHQPSCKKMTTVRQINMYNEAKAACLSGLWIDVDVKCAHPTFLWQILKQQNLPYEQCKHYADNSKDILSIWQGYLEIVV